MHLIYERSSILLISPCAMDKWGGFLSLLRVLAQPKTKVSLLGVFAKTQSHFSLGLSGHRFRGALSLLELFA